MNSSRSLRLFRLFGIDVYLHWAWIIVAGIELYLRREHYQHMVWNAVEYLSLFVLVLMHEFGHALACRSVGGQAERILLWPLGGVAYVRPPFRPGALLWSLAAGPLVNVALIPVTVAAAIFGSATAPGTDFVTWLTTLAVINGALLAFNSLPIYPLDGGQVTRALMWYVVGPHKSLLVAASVGLVASAAVLVAAVVKTDIWIGALGAFGGLTSWRSVRLAWLQVRLARSPRHADVTCASCGEHPPAGVMWRCRSCDAPVDLWASAGRCPRCDTLHPDLFCFFCGRRVQFEGAPAAPALPFPERDRDA